jgi:Flp pilus assembly protein TadD
MQRAYFLLIFPTLVLFCGLAAAQQETIPGLQGSDRDLCDLRVRVVFENERSAPEHLRVRLENGVGLPIAEALTNSLGQVEFRSLPPGNYRLRAEGQGFNEGQVDFTIQRRQFFHSETVRVRSAETAKPAVNVRETAVSAADLRASPDAKKEFEKGNAALQDAKFHEARKRFEKALQEHPDYPSALNNLGIALAALEKRDEARAAFQRAIQADPRFPRPYINAGRILLKAGDAGQAERLLLQGLALDPGSADGFTLLANAQLRQGKVDEGLESARRVHTLEHAGFAYAHVLAAVALEQKGLTRAAADEYRTYLQESPNGPSAAHAKQALARLH